MSRVWKTKSRPTWVRQPDPWRLGGGRQLRGVDTQTQKGRDDPHTGHWHQHLRGKTETGKDPSPRTFQARLPVVERKQKVAG